MAKPQRSNSKSEPSFQRARGRNNWLWAIGCLMLAILFMVAFLDYRPEQSPQITTDPTDENLVGTFGAQVSYFGYYVFGGAAWVLPLFCAIVAMLLMLRVRISVVSRLIAFVVCVISGSALLAMQDRFFMFEQYYHAGPGGLVGEWLYRRTLADMIGSFGAALVFGCAYLGGMLVIVFRGVGSEFGEFAKNWKEWRAQGAEKRAEKQELKRLAREAKEKERQKLVEAAKIAPPPEPKKLAVSRQKESAEVIAEAVAARTKEANANKLAERVAAAAAAKAKPASNGTSAAPAKPATEDAEPKEKKLDLKIVAPEATRKAALDLPKVSGDYTFPKLNLLDEPSPSAAADEEEHAATAEALLRTLSEFGVEVTLGEIHIGPVITRYEIYPAPGVRVEKIASLDKNIALGLRAQSVRILAPVPGKGCVGVEVPNKRPSPVGLREILESEDWAKAKAEIPLALGRDVGGKPVIADLSRMPHLLIAGATGSGKTVCINSIITSLLYFASPDDLRFIMVDPKIVEMKAFNDLPHMLIPVVTDPKKVPAALRWLIAEMEMRYQIFSKVGVRNIAGFNGRKTLEEETPAAPSESERGDFSDMGIEVPRDDEIEIPEKMPYIVCIIDELADLMMVAPADIETAIARLAQLARAAGIHLILATQRPSVNVITGVIKANLPCRVAFQVASKVDSRTILDSGGADQLIGRGDLLFSPPGTAKLIRAQGCFVSDEELNRVVEFLKRNGPPEFAEDVQRRIEAGEDEDGGDSFDEAEDEMYPQALEVLRSTRRASTSMLQRRLRIGYNRAARLMEIMEARGIVGPENGSSPREILADLDAL